MSHTNNRPKRAVGVQFDPVKLEAGNRTELNSAIDRLSFSQSVVQFQSFLESDFWKNIPKTSSSHGVLYSNMEMVFGSRPKFIYDNGAVINGDSTLWESLSSSTKAFIATTDENRTPGFYRCGPVIVTYTGSTAVISLPPVTYVAYPPQTS
jgi:hypothetical protein